MAKAPGIPNLPKPAAPAAPTSAGLKEMPEQDKPLPPGARGLTPEKAAEEKQRFGRELTEEERAAAAVGSSAQTATKWRCATTDGLSATVQHLDGTKYRVQVEKMHRGDSEQPAANVDVAKANNTPQKGPDGRRVLPVAIAGDGSPRHEAVVAFMLACGIRGSDRAISATPLE